MSGSKKEKCRHEEIGLMFSEYKQVGDKHFGKCVLCGEWFDLAKCKLNRRD